VKRTPDFFAVNYGNVHVFVDRNAIARDKGNGGPYLLVDFPAVTATYSPHGNELSLHLPHQLVGELLVALQDASDEVDGEICYIEEQEYEALMAEQDAREAAEFEARAADYKAVHGTFVIDTGDE